ncbi:MAG TPA: SUMF1/EgtB/PvdO family nonheme iron enzyme [Thermoanaerobaculia bacterium]|jgi:formylglycine-generating enzyme required for sulfatase activity
MRHAAFPDGATRADLLAWFREGRARSKQILGIPVEEAYYDKPIALRNPIVFYEGHLPAFNVNTLIKLALREPGIDDHYEILFARGIDPEDEVSAKSPTDLWPTRNCVQKYGAQSDELIERALTSATIEDENVPQLRGGEAALAILEHEQMHHETFLYMMHNLPYEKKRNVGRALARPGRAEARPTSQELIAIPAGVATLGNSGTFGWDNEFPAHRVDVPAFSIQKHNVTNGEFLEFMEATGAPAPHFWTKIDDQWFWRGMFELIPLPLDWPVYAMHDEATAYAKWKGMRIPSEAEYHRAAFGTPSGEERSYPWGEELPDASRGNFDLSHWDPVPAGSYPTGASAWGIHDLVGNGWEWTSTEFNGFEGFQPMPSYPVYSTDFFDGKHYVMKGASPATARHLVRRSFRNWFRPNYPYVYATFRCAL